MAIKIYGIVNCDTVKKVRTALETANVKYEFVDFKKTAPTESELRRWKAVFGDWPVNQKGPTFRKIKDDFEKATDGEKMKLLIENSSAIKRPILEKDGQVLSFGYDEKKLAHVQLLK